MPRATQPVTFEEVVVAMGDYYPDITSETKPADFGRVKGQVLCLDYWLPDADLVRKQRAYYVKHRRRITE